MKGEINKLKFKPLTLDDILVKEGLEAVSNLTGKEPYYVVGGIAAQSYLPTLCRRPTSDIDLSIVRELNYEDFKTLSKPVVESLLDKGYNVQSKKRSRAFCLDIENKEGEKLLIEFSRRNKNSFENSKKKLERELENSKRKIIETKNSTYIVAASEDIIIPKLARSIHSLNRNPNFRQYLPEREIILSDIYLKKRLNFINQIRKDSMDDPQNLKLFEELKLISDIYDIRILSEIAGINIDYFNKASKDWNALSTAVPERDILFSFILPQLSMPNTN